MVLSTGICHNIGPKEIRRRRLMGYLALNMGLVLAIVFIWQDVSDFIRCLVFIPFFIGYLGILQAVQKTCVVLAFNGKQNQDQGPEALLDADLQRKLRNRSIWILIFTILLAGLCTYLTLSIRSDLMYWPQGPALR